jgi:hypothetical protein
MEIFWMRFTRMTFALMILLGLSAASSAHAQPAWRQVYTDTRVRVALGGEFCVVGGGAPAGGAPSVDELVPEVLARVAAGERLKTAVADVATAAGVAKRDLYAAALAAR